MNGRFLLLLAVVILALASPVTKWLIQNGQTLGFDGGNAISFCNVLFVGNLVGGVTVALLFRPRRLWQDLKDTTLRARLLLTLHVLLAVAIPVCIFTALESTSVTNVVLIGRFESVVYALLATLFAGAQLSRTQLAGYGFILAGIFALVLVQGMGRLAQGDYLIAGAACLQALGALLVRRMLASIQLGTFVFVRNFTSAIVFFILAMVLYGPEHFSEAFLPELWAVMLVYAGLIIVVGQLAWYSALKQVPSETVATFTMATPFLGVLFACLLLAEVPGTAQWIGGGIIAAGLVIIRRGAKTQEPLAGSTSTDSGLAGVVSDATAEVCASRSES